jgi:outer membrane receptor for ferrienterochelin and colicins
VSPVGERHLVTVGAQYLDPTMTDGLWGSAANSVRQYSLFTENEWRVLDALTLTGGLRYDNNESYSGHWSPRLYAVWSFSERWTLKGGVGQGFRSPFLEQLTDGVIGFGDQGTVPLYGNPSLSPETSTNFEAALAYNNRQGLRLQGTLFHNRIEDLIERGTGANSGRDLNIGEARIQGVELDLSARISDRLGLSSNYTWTDSEVTRTQLDTGDPAQRIASREGDPLVSVPDHMLHLRLTWQALDRLETFLGAEYRSSAFRPRNFHEPQDGGNAQGAVASGERDSRVVMGDFRGYTLFNVSARYRFSDQLGVTATVYNLLNRNFNDYRAHQVCANGGCTATTTGFSNRYNNILEPRRLYLALNYEF